VLCSVSDLIEFLVPLVVVPLYWAVWFASPLRHLRLKDALLMIVGSVLFTHGHGVHLAANSLSNTCHAEGGLKRLCEGSTELKHYVAALDLFDELVSHVLWIGGIMLFCVALLAAQSAILRRHGTLVRYESIGYASGVVYCVYGAIYGVLFACHNIEGGTVAMGLPFALAIVAFLGRHRMLKVSPVALIFFVSHLVTIALLVSWYIMWGGFPEFSQLPKERNNWIGSFYATTQQKEL
jgi:hypothetical protein